MNLNGKNNLDYKYRIPDWEYEFINIIEQMRTIPYVLLGHFQFMNINWTEENVEEVDDELSRIDLKQIEEKPTSHWNLVRRMIFSKGSVAKDSKKDLDRSKSEKTVDEIKISRNYSRKVVGQLNDIYNQFVDFIRIKKKYRKSSKDKDDFNNSGTLSSSRKNKRRTKKGQILKKQLPNKSKENLFTDLDDLVKKKSHHKLLPIMSKDDGPFMTDYRLLLGIEFWASFCGIDKRELIAACTQNLGPKELDSLRLFNLIDSNKRLKKDDQQSSKPTCLKELKQFFKGTDRPPKAPKRHISPEEKFKIIPYLKLLNPNTDFKKTFYSKTVRDQLNKLYLIIVRLLGNQYPLKRSVGYEEAYEDILLWVLDTNEAKTRLWALLSDQINREIS